MKKSFLAVLCCVWCIHAHLSLDPEMCRLFNKVMMRHIEGIGFALAQPDKYPAVSTARGLAAWWERFTVKGGICALLEDEAVCALAQELHDIARQDTAFKEALIHARLADNNGLSEQERQEAWHLVGVMYIGALWTEANKRGCMFQRGSPLEVASQPGAAGTFPATDEKNWGDLAYLARLMQVNATLDDETYDQLCSALSLAQLILRAELEANRLE